MTLPTKQASGNMTQFLIQEGVGKPPQQIDTVTVHYRGTLIDGTEFESSYSRNQPATFRADQVIAGWKEALQLMKPGDKYELFILADLAYGMRGIGGKIGPNITSIVATHPRITLDIMAVNFNK